MQLLQLHGSLPLFIVLRNGRQFLVGWRITVSVVLLGWA